MKAMLAPLGGKAAALVGTAVGAWVPWVLPEQPLVWSARRPSLGQALARVAGAGAAGEQADTARARPQRRSGKSAIRRLMVVSFLLFHVDACRTDRAQDGALASNVWNPASPSLRTYPREAPTGRTPISGIQMCLGNPTRTRQARAISSGLRAAASSFGSVGTGRSFKHRGIGQTRDKYSCSGSHRGDARTAPHPPAPSAHACWPCSRRPRDAGPRTEPEEM